MPPTKLSNTEVAEIIEAEGLGYAISSYLSSDRIADSRLQEAWQQAETAMNVIESILGVDEDVISRETEG